MHDILSPRGLASSGVQGSKFDPGSVAGFIRVSIFTGVGFKPGFGLEL